MVESPRTFIGMGRTFLCKGSCHSLSWIDMISGTSILVVVVVVFVVCVGVSGKVVVKRVERFCTVGLRSGYE